ncbi:hypothetical protein WMY93_008488 [Mugilogobius chulae]|uniref:Fibrinogen C-terminal domain-containing protein n=1 Tax=Mugilogobius chulae TaxID=88201 RepID=A0AAW0PGG4_9GOBI
MALVCCTFTSMDMSVLDSCEAELAALKKSINKLENNLLIGAWQIRYLQTHKNFQSLHQNCIKQDKSRRSWDQQDSGQLGHNTGDDPPSAGSLIVHDRDCSELFDRQKPPSGFYRIKPILNQDPILVYCDMEDGGGWTVFQKRRHGKVDFNRDWVDYRDGFGDFKLWNDEFWLGNEPLYSLLSEGKNLVKIDLMDWDGHKNYALYENFKISAESDKYRLQYGQYSGKAGDALTGGGGTLEQWSACLNGMQFSTRDQDNDRFHQGSCAQENQAGWWFNRCHAANLNGKFYRKGNYSGQLDNGVVWGTWRGLWYSLRHTTMKVRPLMFLDVVGSGDGAL